MERSGMEIGKRWVRGRAVSHSRYLPWQLFPSNKRASVLHSKREQESARCQLKWCPTRAGWEQFFFACGFSCGSKAGHWELRIPWEPPAERTHRRARTLWSWFFFIWLFLFIFWNAVTPAVPNGAPGDKKQDVLLEGQILAGVIETVTVQPTL